LDNLPFPDQFVREAEHFSSCVFEDRQPGPSGEEGLRDMEWIDRIYKSAAALSLAFSPGVFRATIPICMVTSRSA